MAMDRFGRLVLPGRIRKALHIASPAAFKVEVTGNKVELTPVLPESGRILTKRRGIRVVSKGGKKVDAAEGVRIARDTRP